MNKATKNVILVILSILVIYFGYQLYTELARQNEPGNYNFRERGKITQKIVNGKKVLKETRIGIQMEIPEYWEYEKVWDGLSLRSPNINVESIIRDFDEWTEGCFIGLSMADDRKIDGVSTFDEDLQLINFEREDSDFCSFGSCEPIEIDGRKGVKHSKQVVLESGNELGHIVIELPDIKNRRIYTIESILSSQIEECHDHLDDFIQSLKFVK
jgi:hypothetical protein